MQTKKVLYLLVLIVAIVIAIFYFLPKFRGQSTDSLNKNNLNVETAGTELRSITLTEIATHNSKDSCWTAIDGNVYDVTKFISTHKGGDRILAVCGIDGTDLFTGKSPMGRVHSEMAKAILSKMKIGILQN